MSGSLQELTGKLNRVGDKTKKYADRFYLFALFLFVSAQACCMTNNVGHYVFILLDVSSLFLILVGIYRIVFELCKNWKKALLLIAVILFGFVYTSMTDEDLPFSPVAFAIIGAVGVNADYVLFSGICGNLVMIATNIIITLTGDPLFFINKFQDRDFFYLGDNVFYVSKWNNCSSTDLAAHYFWMIAVYLWIRGRKITMGEIFALGALDFVVYSLSGANTSFLCIVLLLFCAFVYKIWLMVKARAKSESEKAKNGVASKLANAAGKFVAFCARYSYLIIAAFCIVFSALYNIGNPLFVRLNNILHNRLSLGRRGISEYGVHLIAKDVPSFGMSSSADEFYNFIDNSYVSVLVNCGILLLLFYIISLTAIQIRHKKYIYGLIIMAICAVSCIEEHHLPQLPYNMFILLLFADIDVENKTSDKPVSKKSSYSKIISITSFLICGVFLVATVLINLPRFKAVKELDRLDGKAKAIYTSVQTNLDVMVSDGTWEEKYSSMSSYQLGEIFTEEPDDFEAITGTLWIEKTRDPKQFSLYSVAYDPQKTGSESVLDLLITDEVKEIVGNGSAVIEYDAASGKVYAVWYSDTSGCEEVPDGRDAGRAQRFREDIEPVGYYTGD